MVRSLIDVLVSVSVRTDAMAGHLKTLRCPSYNRIDRNERVNNHKISVPKQRLQEKQENHISTMTKTSKHKCKTILISNLLKWRQTRFALL